MNFSKTVTLLLISLFAVYCKRNEEKRTIPSSRPALSGTNIVTHVEYDDHPNPFYHFGVDMYGQIPPVSLSPHNILKSTYTSLDGSVLTATYQYEYDSKGYPRKMTVFFKTREGTAGISQNTKMAY